MKITVILENELSNSTTRIESWSHTGTLYPLVPTVSEVTASSRNAMNACINRAMDLGMVK